MQARSVPIDAAIDAPINVIRCRRLKLLREILSYLAYLIAMTLIAMVFAAAWHDFMAAFHTASHHTKQSAEQSK
jgi:hypothetical protein